MLFLADKNKPRLCTEKGLNETEELSSSASYCGSEEPTSPMPPDTENENVSQEQDQAQDNIVATVTSQPALEPHQLSTKSIPSTSSQLHQHKTKDESSVSNKSSKRAKKIKNLEMSTDERQEEAYMILKELTNKKPRSRFQIFGEHVALKIESLATECAKNTVEHLISTILWEASMGKYDYSVPAMTRVQNTPLLSWSPTDSYTTYPSSNYSQVTATHNFSPSTQWSPNDLPNDTIAEVDNRNIESNPEKNVPGTAHTFSDVLHTAMQHADL